MSFIPMATTFERRQVSMWIKVQGLPISLIRPGAVARTAAGGYATNAPDVVLPPVNRIVTSQAREQFVQTSGQGVGERMKQYLLGTYNDDIRQGDKFVDPTTGKTFRIEYVHDDRTVETRAELTEVS